MEEIIQCEYCNGELVKDEGRITCPVCMIIYNEGALRKWAK